MLSMFIKRIQEVHTMALSVSLYFAIYIFKLYILLCWKKYRKKFKKKTNWHLSSATLKFNKADRETM